MPLQKQYWEMIFGQSGRDARTDEKVLQSPNLSELTNGEIISPGRIQKRNGYVSLEATFTDDYGFDNGNRASRGDILVGIDNYAIAEYNDGTEWANDATSLLTTSEARTLISLSQTDFSEVDIAYYDDHYYIAASELRSGSYYNYLYVFDSNFSFVTRTDIGPVSSPCKVLTYANKVAFFYFSSVTFYVRYVNPSTYKLSSATNIATGDGTNYMFDVDTFWSSYAYAYIGYTNNVGNTAIRRIDGSGSTFGTQTISGTADLAIAVSCHTSYANGVLLVRDDTTDDQDYAVYNYTLTSTSYSGSLGTGGENIIAGPSDLYDGFFIAIEDTQATYGSKFIYHWYVDSSGSTALEEIGGTALAHKYIEHSAQALFFGVCEIQNGFNVVYTMQCKNFGASPETGDVVEPIAKYLYRIGSGIGLGATSPSFVSNCVNGADTNIYHFVALDIDHNVVLCTFHHADSDSKFQRRYLSAKLGDDLLVAGSLPLIWDGHVAREIGFSHPPEIIDDNIVGSGNIADGTYNYVALFTIADNSGRVYKSYISVPYTVVISGGGGTAKVEIRILPTIYRPDWDTEENTLLIPRAELYRTVAGPGSIYYRVAGVELSGGFYAWFQGFPQLIDDSADSTITSNEILYTTGGVLQRGAPPPLDDISVYDNRVWGIDSETGNIYYSAETLEGEGIWFNPVFVVTNPTNIGKPVRLIDTQSFLLVFYKDHIGAIYGQGYNILGIEGNLTSVKLLVNNLGCIEQKSIAKTPNGVIFKAASGFHIMAYDGSPPQYIGSGVSDYDNFEVVSADVIEDKKQVRFGLYHASLLPAILVYSYEFNQWYIWEIDEDAPLSKSGGTAINSTHYLVDRYTGNTLVQDDGYKDGIIPTVSGVYTEFQYPLVVQTPWIKLAGLQGYQRVLKAWILGTFESDHNMTVAIDYDYDDTNTDTVTITDLSAEIGEDLYQVRVGIPNQRCQSIRFKITIDTSSYSEGAGATLSGLRLEYMVKRGGMRAYNFG